MRLHFLGLQKSPELAKLYNSYDVLLQPSPSEGFSRVAIEAMSSGMPVIGRRDCKAVAQLLNTPPYAVGMCVSSPQKAAEEILGLMQNPDQIVRLGENALNFAHGEYSLKNAESAFLSAVNPILRSTQT